MVCQQALKKVLVISARAVLLATGGAGRLYERTTNPAVATGDGMAMAFRAGAELMDMEFIQFHPTALFRKGAPQFLLSEAMRGEGGMLKNEQDVRFMDRYSPARELAPRDVVTRAIRSEMELTGASHVFLDMTHLNADYIIRRFPRIYRTCKDLGIDITPEPIPVSPAAHYIMGGVRTDLWGATPSPASSLRARRHAPESTARTGSQATRSWKDWYSANAQDSRQRDMPGSEKLESRRAPALMTGWRKTRTRRSNSRRQRKRAALKKLHVGKSRDREKQEGPHHCAQTAPQLGPGHEGLWARQEFLRAP